MLLFSTWVQLDYNMTSQAILKFMRKNRAKFVNSHDYIEYTDNCGRWPRLRGSMGNNKNEEANQAQGPYSNLIMPFLCLISAINIIFNRIVYSNAQVSDESKYFFAFQLAI